MKTLKNIRNKKTIFVAIFLALVALILVGIMTNDMVKGTSISKDPATCTHYMPNGVCVWCGYNASTTCQHSWGSPSASSADGHNVRCTKCGVTIRQPHGYNSDGVCGCGYTCAHSWGAPVELGSGGHKVSCSICNIKDVQPHDFKDGKCSSGCGATISQEDCTHEARYLDHVAETEHTYGCKTCGGSWSYPHQFRDGECPCGWYISPEQCTHNFQYAILSSGGHSKYCSMCGLKTEENHAYVEGVCTPCGQTIETENCTHNFQYSDLLNGRHRSHCPICGLDVVELHIFKKGACEACGNTQYNGGSSSGNDSPGTGNGGQQESCNGSHTYNYFGVCTKCGVLAGSNTSTWACSTCGGIDIYLATIHVENNQYQTNQHGWYCTNCKDFCYKQDHEWENYQCKICHVLMDSGTTTWLCKTCNGGMYLGAIEGTEQHGWYCVTCQEIYYKTNHRYVDGKCTVCTYERHEHTEVIDQAVAATCETEGKTEGKHCSECNEVIVAQTTVPATGHSFTKVKDTTQVATCENDGKILEQQKCSKCNMTKTIVKSIIPAKGHTEVTDKAVAATCTATGKTEGKHCSVCNKVLKAQEITEKIPHSYKNGACEVCGAKLSDECEHKECEQKNSSTQHWQECKVCGEIKTGTLENHKYGTYTDNEDGTHSSTCTVCNYKLKVEHTYVDGECKDCGAEKPEEECEHDYDLGKNETHHWKECSKCDDKKETEKHKYEDYTDNENGTHSAICLVCGYKLTEEHETDGTCTDCEKAEPKPGDDDKDNDNENENNTTGDNTTIDKDIPHTGAGNIAVITLFIIGIAGAISAIKMKKYKGI